MKANLYNLVVTSVKNLWCKPGMPDKPVKPVKQGLLSRKAGFSLVEIMIVLAIIGTILGMIGTKIFNAQKKAQVREATIMLNNVADALNMYYNDCGQYPKTLKSLVEPDPDCKNWVDVYYKGDLKDPWKTDFVYELNGNDFTLKSLGNDRREGGSQLNRDIVYGEDLSGSSGKKE